jgi:hypothetical protein
MFGQGVAAARQAVQQLAAVVAAAGTAYRAFLCSLGSTCTADLNVGVTAGLLLLLQLCVWPMEQQQQQHIRRQIKQYAAVLPPMLHLSPHQSICTALRCHASASPLTAAPSLLLLLQVHD